MSTSKTQAELIDRIVKSNSFGRSQIYVDLLKYLASCTEKGNIPKETTIGSQLFGSHAADDFDTAKVRVYIFNLRKKLKQYFQSEGRNEPYILTIPKGSYKVVVKKNESLAGSSLFSKKTNTNVILTAGLALSLIVVTLMWWTQRNTLELYRILPENQFWSEFIDSEKPTLVVFGDLFIYNEHNKATGTTRTIRNPDLNSMADFELYKENINDSTIELSTLTYTYLIKNSTACIEQLTKLFFSNHRSFQTQVVTRMDVKDLHDHNIIFLGMQKTAGMLNNYFKSSNFDMQGLNTYIYHNGTDTLRFQPEGNPDAYHTDYGLVAKFPGPNNNTIIMFGGLWDTAVYQSLKNFSEAKLMAKMEEYMIDKLGHIPKHFEVLLEVSGIDRTELNNKVLILNEIKNPANIWSPDR